MLLSFLAKPLNYLVLILDIIIMKFTKTIKHKEGFLIVKVEMNMETGIGVMNATTNTTFNNLPKNKRVSVELESYKLNTNADQNDNLDKVLIMLQNDFSNHLLREENIYNSILDRMEELGLSDEDE